ncbi:hypothetical protein WMF37_11840 [Sorangium sp. So ce291]|uniref:hypothetical protein n=1 Tax=Sorangium sp. So ce291 TaxID=3133294 RepID=UPI003F5E4D5D
MHTQTNDKTAEFELELYKSLRTESSSALAAIPGLWLQKFVLVGATLGFVFAGGIKPAVASAEQLGILLVPILSILIDCRILEQTLHARFISQFIGREYQNPRVLAAWESALWNLRARSYGSIRTALSSVVTAIPTAGLLVMASTFMHHLLWGAAAGTVYIGAAVLATISLHQRSRAHAATATSDVT